MWASAAGNGSLMRLAPAPLAFAHNPDEAFLWDRRGAPQVVPEELRKELEALGYVAK